MATERQPKQSIWIELAAIAAAQYLTRALLVWRDIGRACASAAYARAGLWAWLTRMHVDVGMVVVVYVWRSSFINAACGMYMGSSYKCRHSLTLAASLRYLVCVCLLLS